MSINWLSGSLLDPLGIYEHPRISMRRKLWLTALVRLNSLTTATIQPYSILNHSSSTNPPTHPNHATTKPKTNTNYIPPLPPPPPELRHQIWHHTLPHPLNSPALIPHKPKTWIPYPIPPTSELYQPTDPDNLEVRFEFSLLDHIQVTTPLFAVNREARAIAHSWAQAQNLSVRQIPSNQTQTEIYTRPFNPHIDILYTTSSNILDLILGPFDRLDEPDLSGKGARLDFELRFLAISEDVVWEDPALVGEVLEMGVMPEVVYVVLGGQPGWSVSGVGVQRWWGWRGWGREGVGGVWVG
ncbi:hypothetical protein BO94DRAFT_619764 [Aspergillus sclerotioniger CBS 115572]|uniref:2EXR domain-containing protein n=1 Tax=Aspergillus sclerotioniger CBS 115572 TaxID=1450535 RepID=A0A317XDT9_9EURO|nr:hypothetical protein BO94DRAFT_619764 [Aspergillus sclerotioniger CBS 115572]PWY96673.1 hypothetical protein BO94DRAFT_619764 [Aspergillus sclerotioniger CBS 115572]